MAGPNLVVNGSFENGTNGWRTNGGSKTPLTAQQGGVKSASAGVITALERRNLILNDRVNTGKGVPEGTRFRVSAWVKSSQDISAEVRVREVVDGKAVVRGVRARLQDDQWQQLQTEFTTTRDNATLDLNVVGWLPERGTELSIDLVSLRELTWQDVDEAPETDEPTAVPTTEAPTVDPTSVPTTDPTESPATEPVTDPTTEPTSAPTEAPPTTSPDDGGDDPSEAKPDPGTSGLLSNGCAVSQRGIPACGAFFGTALGANDDPSKLEALAGQQLGVRRTFWHGGQVTAAVRTAQADLASGRLPWISFKLPHSWADMASGRGDDWALDLAQRLAALDGPVWVAFHHEPETDGNIAEWTKLQERLSPIVRDAAPNVAYTVILTGWHQTDGDTAKYGLDLIMPRTKVDVVGFDVYNRYGTAASNRQAPYDLRTEFFEPLSKWAKKHDMAWAVGETGYTDATAAADPRWLQKTYDDLVDLGGIAMSYFSSSLNATGDWLLDTPDRQDQFVKVLRGTPFLS